jgi:hypothetical protein
MAMGSVGRNGDQRIFAIRNPTALFFHDQFDFRTKRDRQIGILVAGGKVHEHWNVEIGDEIEQEVLELILLRAIERKLAEDDPRDFLE